MSPAASLAAVLALAVPPADVHVDCAARAEGPPGAAPARGGVAATLPGGGRFELLAPRDAGPSRVVMRGRAVWLWKTPAALSAGRSVVLAVGRRQARRARLGWGHPRSFARAPRTARFTSCAEDEPRFSGDGVVGPLTGWGGALITKRRRTCLRLRVREGRASVPLPVPLGRRCD